MVVFDVDGTLLDSQSAIVDCLQKAFYQAGCQKPQISAVRSVIGLSLPEAVGRLAADDSPEVKENIAENYKKNFFHVRTKTHDFAALFDGAMNCIHQLDESDYLLSVATGMSRRGLDAFISRYNLSHKFISLACADDGPGKPNPHMLYKVLEASGVEPHDAVMLGDTSYDMEMARAAGCYAVGVTWGNHSESVLRQAGAHEIVQTFDDFLIWVQKTLPV